MRYLSVCSGIEAASVAWHPLGWVPVAFAEIEAFPSAVLAHHYPDVPNLGDITKFKEWPDLGAIDIVCGGTPCQSFSVAGLRQGLADPRGNLSLTFLAIVDRYRPRYVIWENVPGVLSDDGGRSFASIVGGLGQLGYGWAYRVLDAQYVRVDGLGRAVPQRRRRVFVVGCLGDWRRAAAILSEPESVLGDSPPRREAGEGIARPIGAGSPRGSGYRNDADTAENLVASTGDIAHCLNAGGMGRQDYETETMIATRTGRGPCVKQTVRATIVALDGRRYIGENDCESPQSTCPRAGMATGQGYELCTNICRQTGHAETNALRAAGEAARGSTLYLEGHTYACEPCKAACAVAGIENIVIGSPPMMAAQAVDLRNGTVDGDVSMPIQAGGMGDERGLSINSIPHVGVPGYVPEAADTLTARSSRGGGQTNSPGHNADQTLVATREVAATLTRGAESAGKGGYAGRRQEDDENLVYSVTQDSSPVVGENVTSALKVGTGLDIGQPPCIAFDTTQITHPANRSKGSADTSHALASGAHAPAIAFQERGRDGGRALEVGGDVAFALTAPAGGGRAQERNVLAGWAVRRLMPIECERLQGFPDGYTAITYRGKPAADGPRYKALGNSWAVNVPRWIGRRIEMVERIAAEIERRGRAA